MIGDESAAVAGVVAEDAGVGDAPAVAATRSVGDPVMQRLEELEHRVALLERVLGESASDQLVDDAASRESGDGASPRLD